MSSENGGGFFGRLAGTIGRKGGQGNGRSEPLPEVIGWDIDEMQPDEDEVLERAIRHWDWTQQRLEAISNQVIKFDHGPVAICALADHHFGDDGVDYRRAFGEAELVTNTPGMWTFLIGDLVNQFVIGALRAARDGAHLSILDEWALVRKYLRLAMPRLLGSVGGNHEHWHTMLTGVDYFEDLLRWERRLHQEQRRPMLYDAHEVKVTIQVGEALFPTVLRHKWRLRSMYNPLHGIQQGMRQRGDFVLGFGAHTHEGGISGHTWVGGRKGAAVMVGSYKRADPYARRIGFKAANPVCGMAVILQENGRILLPDTLEDAAELMNGAYGWEVDYE